MKLSKTLPVFMAYIIMGFVDIVGVATGFVQNDFSLPDNTVQLLPLMAFLWFLVLSVPIGIMLDKYGKKNVLNGGIIITAFGMVIPLIHYSFPVMLIAFAMLGIGNVVVQVAANPLLHDVVPQNKYSSFLSISQFIKSICSLLGPIITTFVAVSFGNWKYIFIVYAVASFLSVVWLYSTSINEAEIETEPASFKSCVALLKDKFILMMVLGIFFVVGTEVGMNSNVSNYLKSVHNLSLADASLGISIFFTASMVGRFFGAIMLNWINPKKFFIGAASVALAGLIFMQIAPDVWTARIAIFILGLGTANLFPLIFAIAVEKKPARVNEISGLMVMAITGGAVIPPLMGILSSAFNVLAGFGLLILVMTVILSISLYSCKLK